MSNKPAKIPPTYEADDGPWFVLTLDTQRVACILAGLRAVLKYEGNLMRAWEHNLIKQMIDDMETELRNLSVPIEAEGNDA